MRNKWKLAFFSLLFVVAAVFITFFIMASTPLEEIEGIPDKSSELGEENVSFNVAANKTDLNKVIKHYLEEEGLTGSIDYQVLLKDEVELYGILPVFGQELELKLTFEPNALNNGDLVLKQKSITVGTLNLPVSTVMKMIQNSYQLPDWVQIQPSKELVYVSLQEMELKSDIKVRANSFDLEHDDISFTLLVPVE